VDAAAVSQAQQQAAKEEEAGGFVPALAPRAAAPAPAAAPAAPPPAQAAPRTVDLDPGTIADSVGTLDQAHLDLAASFLARLPQALREAAHEPSGACAIVFGLLLDRDRALRGGQLDALKAAVDAPIHAETITLAPALDQCPVESRLPLVDVALPALRRLSEPQCRAFRAAVERLIAADAKLNLFEFTLQRVLLRRLEPHFYPARPPAVAYGSLRAVSRQASLLLSILAHAGQAQAERAAQAFDAGVRHLADTRAVASLLPFEQCGLADLDRALAALVQAAPAMKRKLLEACAATIAFDRRVTIQEGELLRAISDSLDCPMPPFLPGQALA
jgi:hypothetical protein